MISRKRFLGIASLSLLNAGTNFSYASSSGAWPVLNKWDTQEFEKYSKWVNNVYELKSNGSLKQKGAKLGVIVADNEMNLLNNVDFLQDGNPQISKSEMDFLTAVSHCGSFPKLVFLYYSHRRALPAVVTKIKMKTGGDIRYSSGNHPVGFVDSVSFSGSFGDFILSSMEGEDGGYNFVSGNFRTAPNLEGTDSVPIALKRDFLKPGSMCYNANGHCLLVGKVDDSGEVHFLDSHPDHSVTFNQTLSAIADLQFVSSVRFGAGGMDRCYDGMRNFRLAKLSSNGDRAVYFTNEEMIQFGISVEQYKKMAEIKEKGKLEVNGEIISSYPGLVRASLRSGGRESPVSFLEQSVKELASMFRERAQFVENAWNDVISNGAIVLPNESDKENIYQADGRWEIWSSPSSDVDRKMKYHYTIERLEQMLNEFGNDKIYDFSRFTSRQELARSLIERKKQLFEIEKITYKNSQGREISLNLLDIEKRLFYLSFDPNHSPELRWGAPENSEEIKTMIRKSTPLKTGQTLECLESYKLEQGIRYYPLRQSTPTSLDPEKNPKSPPFKLFDEVIGQYSK